MKCKRCGGDKEELSLIPKKEGGYWECPKCDKLICTRCGAEPFGVQSWWVPRGLYTGDSKMLCPDCMCKDNPDLPKSLNIIEKM